MIRPIIRAVAALTFVPFMGNLNAASTSLNATADAFVTTGPSSNLTGNNYGSGGALAISAAGSAKGEFASVLRFDTSSAKLSFDTTYGVGGWTIDSVQLKLSTATPGNAIFNTPNLVGAFQVRWISSDLWLEGTGTPSAPGATGVKWTDTAALILGAESAGTFSFASVGDGDTANYTMSSSVGMFDDIFAGGSVSLYLDAADSTVSAVLNSRSFSNASRNPAFIITASPIPEPYLLLFGCCIGWFPLLRRLRQPPRNTP